MIEAKILCDSINGVGNRITTWILTYPLFFHAQLKTHRVFSGNSASSRAVPVSRSIQDVIENPAMPETWGLAARGMQSKGELSGWERETAKKIWLESRDDAVSHAGRLLELGLHKQTVNRILEPYKHMTTVLTGTEFENFFALRAEPDTQPEFQVLAYKMLELYNASTPTLLKGGEWHMPFGDKIDENRLKEMMGQLGEKSRENAILKIATARCARGSYNNFYGKDDYVADAKLHDKLLSGSIIHASPAEHCAKAMSFTDWTSFLRTNVIEGEVVHEQGWCRNFRGFIQYRCYLKNDTSKDPRVIVKS